MNSFLLNVLLTYLDLPCADIGASEFLFYASGFPIAHSFFQVPCYNAVSRFNEFINLASFL
jgi:hypothetical protein